MQPMHDRGDSRTPRLGHDNSEGILSPSVYLTGTNVAMHARANRHNDVAAWQCPHPTLPYDRTTATGARHRPRSEGTMTEYRCILCDRHFLLAGDVMALPAHVYPRGLLRRRHCPSSYGVPAVAPVLSRA
jgi:hypothetical protein